MSTGRERHRRAPFRVSRSADRETVRELHRRAVVVDGHNDLPWRIRERWGSDLGRARLDRRGEDGHTDLVRLREGGVDVQVWAAYVPVEFRGPEATRVAREQIRLIHDLVARYPEHLELALSTADVARIVADGRIASVIGVEGGHAIDDSLEALRELHGLGARYLTLTHNASVGWADAAGDAPRSGGLAPFGRDVVAEMNRLGMLVDLSHVTRATMRDALEASRAPVIFSHSSARALVEHPRNVPDDVLRLLAENGGLVMVNFFSGFLTLAGARAVPRLFEEEARIRDAAPDAPARRAALAEWRAGLAEMRGDVGTIADHIEHIARVAGIDHVGLGSDFDGMPLTPAGMEDVSCLPALTEELVRRGHAPEDVVKILGANFLEVWEAAEAHAGP